jgi:hypothetical protein
MEGAGGRVFLSYDRLDESEVTRFVAQSGPLKPALLSGSPDEVARCVAAFRGDQAAVAACLRDGYLASTEVTITLVGGRTWACKEVDWEIRASLLPRADGLPNGLLGIVLPSAGLRPLAPRQLRRALAPAGLRAGAGYARWYWYPTETADLERWVADALHARTERAHLLHAGMGQPSYRIQAPLGECRQVAEDAVPYVLR